MRYLESYRSREESNIHQPTDRFSATNVLWLLKHLLFTRCVLIVSTKSRLHHSECRRLCDTPEECCKCIHSHDSAKLNYHYIFPRACWIHGAPIFVPLKCKLIWNPARITNDLEDKIYHFCVINRNITTSQCVISFCPIFLVFIIDRSLSL